MISDPGVDPGVDPSVEPGVDKLPSGGPEILH